MFVACDVNGLKLNTGIEFQHKPANLQELLAIAEALYTKELQLQTGDQGAQFHCVSCMIVTRVEGPQGKGTRWTEVRHIQEVPHQGQLFLFDWNSPTPPRGPIPPVQFVVGAHQVERAIDRISGDLNPGFGPGPSSERVATSVSVQREGSRFRTRRVPGSQHPSEPQAVPLPITTASSSWADNFNAASPQPNPVYIATTGMPSTTNLGPTMSVPAPIPIAAGRRSEVMPSASIGLQSNLSPEAKQFLFQQLCRASGQENLISTQRLHTIFVENDLTFPTQTFSVMVHHLTQLDAQQWNRLVAEYGPVIDSLYDRIATKESAPVSPPIRGARGEVDRLKKQLQSLEDEEQELMARQAKIKSEILQAKRALNEAMQTLEELNNEVVAQPDRAKEWEMLQKFVALKVRQVRLLEEEARVNHELSLL